MRELPIDPDYVQMLAIKVRALFGAEGAVVEDYGSNPTDDPVAANLQELPTGLRREELVAEIKGLDEEAKNALVGLMWVGMGERSVEEWDDVMRDARENQSQPAEDYLLDRPLVADFWMAGLEAAGYGGQAGKVERIS